MSDTTTYWAAEADTKELVKRALERFGRALAKAERSGQLDRTRRMLLAYYGRGEGGRDTSRTRLGGRQGELALMVHNGVRPLISQVLALVCGQRPGLKPVATNTDASSIAATELADGVRKHYERTLELPGVELDVARGGFLGGAHWGVLAWKRTKGEPYGIDESGRLVYEGGVEVFSLPWWRMAADPLARRPIERNWVLFKRPANRFELAAEYPECADRLVQDAGQLPSNDWGEQIASLKDFDGLDELFGDNLDPEDGVWVWELRHLPTAALPRGRIVRFVSGDIVLFDSASFKAPAPTGGEQPVQEEAEGRDVGYPYAGLHAYDFASERVVGTARGHSGGWDMLGLQELLDVCTSTTATVVNLYGAPHLWAGAAGAGGIHAAAMGSGPIIIETATKPEVINLLDQALSRGLVDVTGFVRDLLREAGQLNKTVMGEPDKNMPAQAQALQRAQAVQVHQTAQGEFFRLVENLATGCLQLSQRFAKTKQMAEIAGKAGTWELKEWSREDVANVPRFSLEIVNPLTQSYEGRQAEAEFLAERGWLTKDGYLSLKSTGSLKEPLEADNAKLELLAQHKQLLRDGIGLPPLDEAATELALMQNPLAGPVFVDDGTPHVRLVKLDPHWLTIPEYYSVLLSPAARENPAVVDAVTGVVQESLRLWASLTPDELAVMGGPPLPSQMQASTPEAPMPGGEGAPAPGAGPTSSGPSGPPGEPQLPKPPPDPITQQQPGRESLGLTQ